MAVPVASMPDTGDTPFVNSIRAHIPLNKGVGGPYPAPSGYRWAQVVEDGQPVTEDGQFVMELQRIAA